MEAWGEREQRNIARMCGDGYGLTFVVDILLALGDSTSRDLTKIGEGE